MVLVAVAAIATDKVYAAFVVAALPGKWRNTIDECFNFSTRKRQYNIYTKRGMSQKKERKHSFNILHKMQYDFHSRKKCENETSTCWPVQVVQNKDLFQRGKRSRLRACIVHKVF